jgi:predicted RNA-binding Zn-ribbon protein involved in translation (DUF1610 family)
MDEVTATLPKITEALAAVHDAGIVHLNLKPHSIIRSEEGDIRLVGFTAAIRQTERPQIIAGSPGYTSGEQITGKDLGPSADVFALGLLFYELLTGRSAFSSEEKAALFSMPAEIHVPSDSSIPQHLVELIHRMTQPSRDERIASCERVLKGLGLGLAPQPGAATPRKPEEQGLTIASPASAEPLSLSDPMAAPAPEPQLDLESLLPSGPGTFIQPTPTAPSAPSTLEVMAESPPLAPPAPEFELQLPLPPAETPAETLAAGPEGAASAGPAAPRSTASGKIHMQCPNCGLVVRAFPEVFARPVRCPDCNVESSFTPELQEKPAEAPADGTAAPSSTVSGKIHMKCPNCGLVVRGFPYAFAKPIRCPDCNVESSFKPESQETAPKPAEVPAVGPEAAAPDGPAAPSSTSSGKIHMQCPHCGLVVRGFPYVFAKPIRCPDCGVESSFKPESQETASKPEDKSGSGWKKWGSSLLKRRGK